MWINVVYNYNNCGSDLIIGDLKSLCMKHNSTTYKAVMHEVLVLPQHTVKTFGLFQPVFVCLSCLHQ